METIVNYYNGLLELIPAAWRLPISVLIIIFLIFALFNFFKKNLLWIILFLLLLPAPEGCFFSPQPSFPIPPVVCAIQTARNNTRSYAYIHGKDSRNTAVPVRLNTITRFYNAPRVFSYYLTIKSSNFLWYS